jgi:hypothetical protein
MIDIAFARLRKPEVRGRLGLHLVHVDVRDPSPMAYHLLATYSN